MNAYELADELDSRLDHQAANMLRQQQAEIERLIGSKPITYGMLTFCKNCGEQNPYQAKTLTDEEIQKLAFEYLEKTDKGIVGVYDFVRAILQKVNNG